MYFYGYFLINFFILRRRTKAITWDNFVLAKRDPVLPGWNVLHVIAGCNLWRVYNTAGILTKRDKISSRFLHDYMIPVSRDELPSRLAGIPAVLQIFHKLHPAITCKTFHPGNTGSLFFTAAIPLCQDKILPCNHFSLPRRDKTVIHTSYP